jgi:hypothetical protein
MPTFYNNETDTAILAIQSAIEAVDKKESDNAQLVGWTPENFAKIQERAALLRSAARALRDAETLIYMARK